ncbi:D-lactate dehydrogenase [Microlunatus soli]|uniref:D-lactate dehydrogenase (cytochrome) n=1 Tax=Microlunatus soli TaxID=630515 RepID=A0A1H2AIJ0_9ACTN|nr:D-lactate dehydrogenase [Microlunatus soli]
MIEALGDPAIRVTERPLDLAVRAHDASHYLLHPRAVAIPDDADQVATVMAACHRLGLPLTFRSGGTSLSGQALSDSVLVDTRTGFGAVEILDDGNRVRVQPGVTVRAVNARLASYRRRLGPDPASEVACTLGGVLANNSSGMQCGTEQNSYATVESMVLVLPSGTVVDSAAPDADRRLAALEPALHAGLLRIRDAIRADVEAAATLQRLFSIKNTMGYGLNAFLDVDDPVDILVKLMIGSEGTLGFVASAVLRTVPVQPKAATGLLVLPDLEIASALVPQVLATGVATAELLDAVSLRVAATDPSCPDTIRRLDVGTKAALLVELQGDTDQELDADIAAADAVFGQLPLENPAALTRDAGDRAALWRIRKGLFSAVAGARPSGTNALLEDVAVPVDRLGELSTGLVDLFDRHDYEAPVIFGHARDGNLHFLLNEHFGDRQRLRRYQNFTEDMVDLVLGLDGTLKAEHGTGRIMAPFLERQYGAGLTRVMHELKTLIDPAGILNPGTLISTEPDGWLQNLKTAEPVEAEVDRCVECGFCEPVCPSRSLTLTPRQRIVARREIAAAEQRGDVDHADGLRADHDYEVLDTCAVDGLCATACPVLINTGSLVSRLRAEETPRAVQRAWAVAADHWSPVTRLASTGLTAASHVPGIAAAASRVGRRVVDHELLPEYDAGLPRGGRPRTKITAPQGDPELVEGPTAPKIPEPVEGPAAVWFASCLGSMFGSAAAEAFGQLCRRAGVELRTPDDLDGLCCGLPWKSKGLHDGQDRMRRRVRAALDSATDGGRLPVIVEASSCAEGLQVSVEDAGFRVIDALDFVAQQVLPRLRVTGRLDRIVVHPTCATTALGSTDSLVRLAEAVAEEVIVPTSWGCCGFAGDRGLLQPELTAAATAPEAAEVAALPPASAYVSSNRTCEIGLTRATGQQYQHVLEIVERLTRV